MLETNAVPTSQTPFPLTSRGEGQGWGVDKERSSSAALLNA